jgi:hypothetical protein
VALSPSASRTQINYGLPGRRNEVPSTAQWPDELSMPADVPDLLSGRTLNPGQAVHKASGNLTRDRGDYRLATRVDEPT